MRWKQLDQYHKISDSGVITVTKQHNRYPVGTILKGWKTNKGYIRVKIGGKPKMLHRVVGELFVPGKEPEKEINHINGIRDDNRASNLEWVSHKENIRHSIEVLNHKIGGARKNGIKIIDGYGNVYDSIKEAATFFGINYSTFKKYLYSNKKINGLLFERYKKNNS